VLVYQGENDGSKVEAGGCRKVRSLSVPRSRCVECDVGWRRGRSRVRYLIDKRESGEVVANVGTEKQERYIEFKKYISR
jgi:hypothetical protein